MTIGLIETTNLLAKGGSVGGWQINTDSIISKDFGQLGIGTKLKNNGQIDLVADNNEQEMIRFFYKRPGYSALDCGAIKVWDHTMGSSLQINGTAGLVLGAWSGGQTYGDIHLRCDTLYLNDKVLDPVAIFG